MSGQDTASKTLKVLIVNENLWEGEDQGYESVSEVFKKEFDKFFKEVGKGDEFIFENVTVIDTPKAALEKLTEFKPDIVIIDCCGLENIKLDDFVRQLRTSSHWPKEIIAHGIDAKHQKDMLTLARNLQIKYTEWSTSISQLFGILEDLHKSLTGGSSGY